MPSFFVNQNIEEKSIGNVFRATEQYNEIHDGILKLGKWFQVLYNESTDSGYNRKSKTK